MHVEVDDGEPFDTDEILVSIGRTPRTHRHRARDGRTSRRAATSAPTSRSGMDDRDWLYAIGDVNGRALLTHMGHQGRPANAIMGKDVRLRSTGCVAAGDLHRPAGRGGGVCLPVGAEEAGLRVRAVDVETGGNAGGSFVGRGAPAPRASSSTRITGSPARRSPGRRSQRRPRRDDRRRRGGPARRPLARRAVFPHALGALAAAARVVRTVVRRGRPAEARHDRERAPAATRAWLQPASAVDVVSGGFLRNREAGCSG